MKRFWGASFVTGFVVASTLFGGLAVAQDVLQKDIRVSYLPLRFIFDGEEKAPPSDQQGFTYNGRTYVPLRFVGEALGKPVDYEASTYTIFLGRKPSPLPTVWTGYKADGEAALKIQHFETGVRNARGEEMPMSTLITATAVDPADPTVNQKVTTLARQFTLDGTQTTLSGTLFVPDEYFGHPEERSIGQLVVLNERNESIYTSDVLTTSSKNIPFAVEVKEWSTIRLFIKLFQNQGLSTDRSILTSHLGIMALRLN